MIQEPHPRPGYLTLLVITACSRTGVCAQRIWPEPLGKWLSQGRIKAECVAGMHEAAAEWVRCGSEKVYKALLVDVDYVTTAEIEMLQTIKRHMALPIWSMPVARKRREMIVGILPWEDAARAMAQFLMEASTQEGGEGNSRNPAPILTPPANPASQPSGADILPIPLTMLTERPVAGSAVSDGLESGHGKPVEMPVESQVVARYDGFISQPVLTPGEIQALLGRIDT